MDTLTSFLANEHLGLLLIEDCLTGRVQWKQTGQAYFQANPNGYSGSDSSLYPTSYFLLLGFFF